MLTSCLSCGHLNKVPPYYEATTCNQCGKTIVQQLSSPEKMESKTKLLNLPVRIAQIKIRDDNGPTSNLGPPEHFLQIGDKFYDLKFIKSVPGYHVGQLEFCDE